MALSRETKWNLIFIVVLLVLITPGGVILFIKKLDPKARIMYMPDPVQHQAAIMDPNVKSASVERVIPPVTANWIHQLAREKLLEANSLLLPGADVQFETGSISSQRCFELVYCQQEASTWRVGLVVWDGEMLRELDHLVVEFGKEPMLIFSRQSVAVPKDVTDELQGLTFVNSPAKIGWIQAEFHSEQTAVGQGGLLRRVISLRLPASANDTLFPAGKIDQIVWSSRRNERAEPAR